MYLAKSEGKIGEEMMTETEMKSIIFHTKMREREGERGRGWRGGTEFERAPL